MRTGALLLCCALGAAAARADEPPPATHWYGYQVLLADGAAVGLALGATAFNGTYSTTGIAFFSAAGLVFVGAAPAIHYFGHQRPRAALWSLALRTAIPLGAAGLGYVIGLPFNSSGTDCQSCAAPAFAFILGGLALAAAPFIDTIGNSNETIAPRAGLLPVTDRGHLARGLALALRF